MLAALLAALLAFVALTNSAGAADGPCATAPTLSHHVAKGTSCSDVIFAPPRADRVYGGAGNDRIYAPPGVDVANGGPGKDKIYISPYGQTAQGGPGDDVIIAKLTPSTVRRAARSTATASTDCPSGCYLGVGGQTYNGGNGTDIVYGQRNNDTLNGGGGNDLLYGGVGDDNVYGGTGNDLLSGGWGADDVDGQSGNDFVRGDGTTDTIEDTGGGTDTLSYATGVTPGFPDVAGYPAFSSYPNFPTYAGERGVYLNLVTSVADNSTARYGGSVDTVRGADFENVIGTPFSDYIVGNNSSNTIWGGGGGDVILGGNGNDALLGGADGDHLDGGSGSNNLYGNAGADYCRLYSYSNSCEPSVNRGGVLLRDPSKISVGMMAPEAGGFGQVYVTGSSGPDSVIATYNSGSPVSVTLTVGGGSGVFDQTSAASSGCQISSPTKAVCSLGSGRRLESIVLAGMGGDDSLAANGFPTWATVVGLGGEGSDSVSGGALSEDILIDGPDSTGPGNDVLNGFGGDDALVNNDGADQLFGSDGNDLILSVATCNGDLINGGADSDNASWAKYTGSGVEARLAEGIAGRPGDGTTPDCGGGPFDSLQQIESLEGSSQADALYGDAGPNSLLGRAGSDSYYAGDGDDKITANSADLDPVIDCGNGADTAVIDAVGYGDQPNANCETVNQAGGVYSG